MDVQLPAHLEAASLIRRTQAEGGFATVIHKGEAEAGTIMLILCKSGTNPRIYERMPQPDGARIWVCTRAQDVDSKEDFNHYIERRIHQDRDMWIIELDVAQGERLIGLAPPES
jgi:hypothetical protein